MSEAPWIERGKCPGCGVAMPGGAQNPQWVKCLICGYEGAAVQWDYDHDDSATAGDDDDETIVGR